MKIKVGQVWSINKSIGGVLDPTKHDAVEVYRGNDNYLALREYTTKRFYGGIALLDGATLIYDTPTTPTEDD